MKGKVFTSEKERRSVINSLCHEYVVQGNAMWEKMSEGSVVKAMRAWLRDNELTDVSIFVSPTTERRYHLVPAWALTVWVRNNPNVYHYPLEPDEHE